MKHPPRVLVEMYLLVTSAVAPKSCKVHLTVLTTQTVPVSAHSYLSISLAVSSAERVGRLGSGYLPHTY